MKRRKPDLIYDGFRDKFFEHESTPLPDSKEKIFNEFYSQELNNKPSKKSPSYSLAIAASFIGLLMVLGFLYLINATSEKNTVLSKSDKVIVNPGNEVNNQIIQKKNTITSPSLGSNSEPGKKSELKTYRSEKEKLVLFLPDSSKAYLNKNSELSFADDFTKSQRTVYMKGEVYFDVKKMNKKPFVVYSTIGRIEVLGTSFCVKSLPEGREEVIVESGKVLFAEKDNKEKNNLIMTPGMKAYLDPGKPIVNLASDHTNDLSWKTNKLIFNKSPIKEVIENIENYFEVKIKIEDPKVLNCHFTGNFDKPKSLEDVLEIISLSINGSYEIKNGEYILTSKGCN